MKSAILLAIAILIATPLHAADPSPDEIKGLIAQLGDGDYAAREAAYKKLKSIGKPALPALKEAAKGEDAEIASRAQNLIKRIEVPPLPGGPVDANAPAPVIRMRVSAGQDGARTLDITEPTREISITINDDGIRMVVRATGDGEQPAAEYTAKSEDELKQENREAFALYERYAAGGPGMMLRGGLILNGPGIIQLQPQRNEVMDLRAALDKQMRDKDLGEKERATVDKALDELSAARLGGDMQEYTKIADAARKTLEDLKLDPGQFLPPPAKTRLGVSVGGDLDMLRIDRVAADSRGEKIGLKPGDVLSKVDGKRIATVGELRKAVSAKEKGLVIEVIRDGEAMKLQEKE